MESDEDRVTPLTSAGGTSARSAASDGGRIVTNDSIDKLILSACEASGGGLADKQIVECLGRGVSNKVRLQAYNRLLSRGRLALAERRNADGLKTVVYQWVSAAIAGRLRGLDSSDRMVYSLVSRAGDAGVTRRDLKSKTNIQGAGEIKQIIERLVARKLIKEISSVQGVRKKVLILAELEPSDAHTGGPWYNEVQQFDQEFIGTLYAYVLSYISGLEHVSVEQACTFVAETNISKETLRIADIRQLMTTMLYDGQIETCAGPADGDARNSNGSGSRRDGGGSNGSGRTEYFRKSRPTPAINQMASVPCGSCAVAKECSPKGVISPRNCVYMDTWLQAVNDW